MLGGVLVAVPRAHYKTAADEAAENAIAAVVEQASGLKYLRIGRERPGCFGSRIDGAMYSGDVMTALVELKTCKSFSFNRFGSWQIAESKIRAAREVGAILKVPVFVVVRFDCGTVATLNTARNYMPGFFGRSDRPGDPTAKEPSARFQMSQMNKIHDGFSIVPNRDAFAAE